jgi:hypothetical protein
MELTGYDCGSDMGFVHSAATRSRCALREPTASSANIGSLGLVKDAEDPQQNNDWDGDSDQPKQNAAHWVFLYWGLITHQRIGRRVGSSAADDKTT